MVIQTIAAILGSFVSIVTSLAAARKGWRWWCLRRASKCGRQVSTAKHSEVLSLTYDDSGNPVGGHAALSLFMNDLSRIHARTGSMPLYEVQVKGYTDTRLELERLEAELSNDTQSQTRRFDLRRAVDSRRVSGGLPVDLYITEAVGVAARQIRPGRLTWINTHEQYVDAFMAFMSVHVNGWPTPSDPFDIFPLEGTVKWSARMYLPKPETEALLSAEGCPSLSQLTREWGLRVKDCPVETIQKRVIPGLLQCYLRRRPIRPECVSDEDLFFGNMSEYGIGYH